MSKKTVATEVPKPIAIPNPDDNPAVAEAQQRQDVLGAKLSATSQERKKLEAELGIKQGESDDSLEARMMAKGLSTDGIARLRELRRSEHVIEKAIGIVSGEVKAAREKAIRELTDVVREQIYLPNVRAAVKDWLEAVRKAESFRRIVQDIHDSGLGNGMRCPLSGAIPLTLADEALFKAFVGELIADGFTDSETVNKAFPNLI